ncbi:MAG: type II secretion system protein GspM [Myxococcales bacterium]|jgi:hypothetical protein
MDALLDRLRQAWENLNDRERRMVAVLGVLLAAFILGFPLLWIARENGDIADENQAYREALTRLQENSVQLKQRAEIRRRSQARYKNTTPALGSFLEQEAEKHGLTIREVTDQPEKTVGRYTRRNVRASLNDVDLTGLMNLLSGIVTSRYPVGIEFLQIEHYQPGDEYRVKLGVLTFDRKKFGGGDDEDGED